MLTGQNGILTQAKKAKEATKNAQAEEEKTLQEYENYLNNVTGDVSQVSDSNPGVLEGSGTEQEPFVINSIEDLVVFADNVTKGTNNYQDQYVELGLSLDFNSDKSYVNPSREDYAQYGYNGKLKEVLNNNGFIPIGAYLNNFVLGEEVKLNSFNGIFNGNDNKIQNMKISEKIESEDKTIILGMFASNYGKIENLEVKNAKIDIETDLSKFTRIAILVGNNNGNIEKCGVSGNINAKIMNDSSNIGGIAGSNYGQISECYNNANLFFSYYGSTGAGLEVRMAGISGINEEEGMIFSSYNTGEIRVNISESTNSSFIGLIGGISGRNLGQIANVNNIGNILNEGNNIMRIYIGSLIAANNDVEDGYFLENTVHFLSEEHITLRESGTMKTSEQMKKNEFLELLNNNNEKWKIVKSKNNGYPILNWE